jgi:hypothetical protein
VSAGCLGDRVRPDASRHDRIGGALDRSGGVAGQLTSPTPLGPGAAGSLRDRVQRSSTQALGIAFLALNSEPLLLAARSTRSHWMKSRLRPFMVDRFNRLSSLVIADAVIEHVESQGGNRNYV